MSLANLGCIHVEDVLCTEEWSSAALSYFLKPNRCVHLLYLEAVYGSVLSLWCTWQQQHIVTLCPVSMSVDATLVLVLVLHRDEMR